MKNKLVKYLLFLFLLIYPLVLGFSACKEKSSGTEHYVSISRSSSVEKETDESISIESIESVDISSDVESEESSSKDSSPDTIEDSSSIESESSIEDEDENAPQDDFSEGSIQGNLHRFVTDGAEPDCTTDGFFKEWCEECGVVTQYYIIPALQHSYNTIEGYSPTCQKTGRTEMVYCWRCGITEVEMKIIPVVDHEYELGLGSCIWCDKSVLRFEVAYREHPVLMRQYYAVCVGAEKFTPYSITHFVNIPDRVTLYEANGTVYEDIPVIEIAEKAFQFAYDVNTLIIGENIEKIGSQAFEHCVNLREVYDKSQMRVGELEPTKNGDITRIVDPKDIHYTDDYISKISVDEESGCIMYTDGDLVELIGIRDTTNHVIIPEGVTKISSCVFYKTRVIKALTIAKSVNFIAQYAFAFNCDKHEEEGHTNEKCKFQLKTIIFRNQEGWRAYEYLGQKYMPFLAKELTHYPTGAWKKLVMEYLKYYWVRTDNFVIPEG